MEVERINPILHCRIGRGLVVVGRRRIDLGKTFPGGHRVNRSLRKIDQEQEEIWSNNVIA